VSRRAGSEGRGEGDHGMVVAVCSCVSSSVVDEACDGAGIVLVRLK
jgi:hypothetical protein